MGWLRRLRNRLLPEGDVTEQTVKSGIWVGATNVGSRLAQMAMLVVLARLLDPADFGLFGITLLALSALKRFSQLGLDQALIQRYEENVDHFLDTVWTLQAIRGLVLSAIAIAAAPLIAEVFNEPEVVPLLRVVTIAVMLQMLYNPGTVYFQKDLQFHKDFALTMSGNGVRAIVSVAYALVSPTVWALIVGFVVGNFSRLIVSYAIHDYRPWPAFDRELAGEMIGYGKWILGSGVVSFLFSEGDDAFVGWFLSSSALGVYQLAYRLSNAPATEIAQTVSKVVMPTYSKIQDDLESLRDGFYTVLRLSTLVSFPVGIGIIVVAPVFVPVFLGDGWGRMVVPMQILTGYGVLRSVRSPTSPLFKALGRPDYVAKIQMLRLILLAALIYPLTSRYGLAGTSASVLTTGLLSVPLGAVLAVRVLEDDVWSFLQTISYPAVGSAVMGVGALAVRRSVVEMAGSAVAFVATVLTGVVVYTLVMFAFEQRFDIGLSELVAKVKGSF
jgi:O-antigen/teichoic acid export membrane protein